VQQLDPMRRLFAVLISALLIFGFAPVAKADVAGLTPCADGLPHLIVDGRLSHAGDFIIPGIAFLYIAGCIGWAGRNYLIAIRGDKDATMKEIQIDLPLAFKSTLAAATWPIAAFGALTSGKLTEADDKITVSPR
jgi:photosystem I subunit 3